MEMTTFIFWVCTFIIVYGYLLYPLFLYILNIFWKPKPHKSSDTLPNVSVIISMYNEEKVIRERIENCLSLDYPKDHIELIFASDASDDRTNEIVREYAGRGVVLYDYPKRRGKVNVLNETVPKAKHDILIFSDANTMFAKDALKKLVRHFEDPKIGCVCGRLQFVSAEGSKTGELEGVYWRFETYLKTKEGRRGSLLGANGGIYALRKELFFYCPPDTIVEDFVVPMKILQKGFKVIYEPQALATEEAAKHIVHEKQRRIRIGAGDFQALFMLLPMLSPLKGFSSLAFWSHKVIRWFVPFFLIFTFIANLLLIDDPFYLALFIMQCGFYVFAFIGQALSWVGVHNKLFNLCYYFVSMNLALLLGFFRFVAGRQNAAWERTER